MAQPQDADAPSWLAARAPQTTRGRRHWLVSGRSRGAPAVADRDEPPNATATATAIASPEGGLAAPPDIPLGTGQASPSAPVTRGGQAATSVLGGGEYATTETPGRLGIRGRLLAGVLTMLLGFAIAVQVRTAGDDELLARASRADLVRILDGLNQRSDALEQEILELESTKRELRSGADAGRTAIEAATDRARTLGVLAGTVAATGPGVEIDIRDPNVVVPSAALLSAVQELRDAGAEAIQVRGSEGPPVRVVVNTFFLDTPEGSLVGQSSLQPPYRIWAIGDPATLATAMSIPGGVIAEVANLGGTATVRQSSRVVIDALIDRESLG